LIKNIVRWNIEDLPSADDYVLRLTARDVQTSTITSAENADQIAYNFVYNISLQQSGLFLIDTQPPEAVLSLEGVDSVTSEVKQIINVFAEDETTGVQQIQLRECLAQNELTLGELGATSDVVDDCASINDLLSGTNIDFDKLISDIPVGNLSKVHWEFNSVDDDGNPASAVKKVEALLTDIGGNNSLQKKQRSFISVFDSIEGLNDFLIRVEQRDKVDLSGGGVAQVTTATFEVLYVAADSGQLWILEPFSRLVYTITGRPDILKLQEFSDLLFLFTYHTATDTGAVYRHDSSEATLLQSYTSGLFKTTGTAVFNEQMYIGAANGELWSYNGLSFSLTKSFASPISTLFADNNYLYIGFQNSQTLIIYNGTDFTTLIL